MYKKITAFLLIFIILFNFIAIEKVKAEPITLGTGFLVFAALLTTFGVTLASVSDMEVLYGKFQKDLGTSFQAFKLSARMVYESILSLGSNFQIDWEDTNLARFIDWVKLKFQTGENNLTIEEEFTDRGYVDGLSYNYDVEVYPSSTDGLYIYKIYLTVNGLRKAIESAYSINSDVRITNSLISEVTKVSGGYNFYYSFISFVRTSIYPDGVEYISKGYITYEINELLNENPYVTEINYIGADVLTNPTYKPEKIPFPPPPINLPGIQDTSDGRTYIGTPGQLVQELEDNPEAVREMAGKYIGQNPASVGGIGSVPTYNETTGTITFPNSTASNPAWDLPVSVDSPWDIPIEVPADVPVPNDIPYGLGVIGWLLHYIAQGISGIWNFLTNLFSAPTKTLNFDSLMNLDVKEKFPFCLPWDLYNSVATISASPQIPIFEAELKNVPIKIDFTQFEELAKIVRWATTLIYSISLVMISRRLIGGE